jgi:aminopeptidase N
MDLYFARFDGMAVTCDDFINAMSDASGVNLTLFKNWYHQSGTPILHIDESFADGQYQLTIEQKIPLQKGGKAGEALHIPISIELIENNKVARSELLELTSDKQTWKFDGYTNKPVLAVLADFSAPVKLSFNQTDKDLTTIMAFADDEFCRWDAGQQLMLNYIKELVKDETFILPKNLLITYQAIFEAKTDNALKAEQLTLPSFDEVIAEIEQVDPIKVVNAISTVKLFLVKGLNESFRTAYADNKAPQYKYGGNEVGERALKNVCLSYLSLLDEDQQYVSQQYQASDNMTDTLAALVCSAKNNLSNFDEQLQHFEKKWHNTPLVMDKWFSIAAQQSTSTIFSSLEKLLTHPLFSLKNPNRARSLLGNFSVNNPRHFHCKSGQGYQFLAKQIALLNEINPQVASRLITPLIQFKSFDLIRQQLMRVELEKLTKLENLSKDLKEKLDATLAP